jgi:enoyl-CoA hydratase/carnithine racemase
MTAVAMLQFDVQASGIAAEVAIVDLACDAPPAALSPTAIVIGVDRAGAMPMLNAADFDLLLTVAPQPTHDWIAVNAAEIDSMLEHLCAQVRGFGLPAAVLAQVLRIGSGLPVPEALLLESFAYSALLGGQAFRDWLLKRAPRAMPSPGTRVRCTREGEILTITLAHPSRRNAIDACMRDELVEHLAFACDDPTLPAVHLRADGADFSAGGELAEFGESTDLVRAHAIRTLRSPALLMHSLAARTTAFLHGACVGAGIEIPAAAGHVVATPDTRFWLPELQMGLMPGAGGTVTIARRIGRRRMLLWALTGRQIDARTALQWRLVDEVRPVDEVRGYG